MTIELRPFGQLADGRTATLYSLTNAAGNRVQLTDFGAILVSLEVPDRDGQLANVNLGYDDLGGYLERHPYFGSTVGRFCNRIANGRFEIDGRSYELAVNNGPNHLHGGINGFDRILWNAEEISTEHGPGIRFTAVSPDGDEGYPGNLTVRADYTWNDANELTYRFEAETDAPTVVNLTNHAYWNLSGVHNRSIRDHEVQLHCDQYLEVDDTLIPTGEIAAVEDTVLDFRSARKLGERLDQLPATNGYDHCYVINGQAGGQPRVCGTAFDPHSGRTMEVLTTQPGMQLYTGNHLDGEHQAHSAFCMETQHYPDSPNKPGFPTTRLNPGDLLTETTIHRFSAR